MEQCSESLQGLSPVVGQNHKTPPGPLITFWRQLFQYFWLFFGGTEGGTTAPYCHCFPFQNCGWLVQRRCCSFAQRMERCGTKQEVIFRFLSVRASLKIDMLPTNASGCGTRKHWKSSKNYVVCLPATFVGPLTTQLHGKTLRALPVRVAA